MITGIDHIVLVCPDLEGGIAAYETLLGRPVDWRSVNDADGTSTALFRVENTALELMAPHGHGPVGARLADIIAENGPGLASLAFSTADLDETHRVLGRRGLAPSDITAGEGTDPRTGRALHWRRFRCGDNATGGLRTFVITERSKAITPTGAGAAAVNALDHFVIGTPNIERAVATYGGRLGLRLALDRKEERWNTHFLFFRTGDLTFEIVKRLDQDTDLSDPDRYYGITWQTPDIDAARARLHGAGLDVSEVRTGRKPGSQVFTVRDGTLGVPTLFIAHGAR
ncbi:MAG: VOC family protein [Pseudomonadota bacterium]